MATTLYLSLLGQLADSHAHRALECRFDRMGQKVVLLQHVLRSALPEEEKTASRLAGELISATAGAIGAMSNVLAYITYMLLTDGVRKARLEKALRDTASGVQSNPLPLRRLKEVPYLVACMKEGLR